MNSKRGFSLLEVMMVLAIFGAVIAVGLPRFRSQENNLKTTVRQMSSVFREIRNEARMKRMTYRLVMRLGSEKDAYWIEAASGSVLIPSQTTMEEMERLDEKERPASPFQKVTRTIKEEKVLPSGIKFQSVETPSLQEPVTEGLAYIYFTPEGLVEKGVIQFKNQRDNIWTLIVNPLTGHSDIVEEPMALKDLKFE